MLRKKRDRQTSVSFWLGCQSSGLPHLWDYGLRQPEKELRCPLPFHYSAVNLSCQVHVSCVPPGRGAEGGDRRESGKRGAGAERHPTSPPRERAGEVPPRPDGASAPAVSGANEGRRQGDKPTANERAPQSERERGRDAMSAGAELRTASAERSGAARRRTREHAPTAGAGGTPPSVPSGRQWRPRRLAA